MQNNSKEQLSKKIVEALTEYMLNNIQDDVKQEISNIYDTINALNPVQSDDKSQQINYVLQKLLEQNKFSANTTVEEVKHPYQTTANPRFLKDENNIHYELIDNKYVQTDVIEVKSDGSYIEKQNVKYSGFYTLTTYDINNQIINLQLRNKQTNYICSKHETAEILGFKKEYAKKYKYSGYSGQSHDMITALKNIMSTPIETGYYIDKYFRYYKWNFKYNRFEREPENAYETASPLLVDIEFTTNNTVIKKEYKGYLSLAS